MSAYIYIIRITEGEKRVFILLRDACRSERSSCDTHAAATNDILLYLKYMMKNVPFENENRLNLFSVECVWCVRPTIYRDCNILYTIRHNIIYGRPRLTIMYNMYMM